MGRGVARGIVVAVMVAGVAVGSSACGSGRVSVFETAPGSEGPSTIETPPSTSTSAGASPQRDSAPEHVTSVPDTTAPGHTAESAPADLLHDALDENNTAMEACYLDAPNCDPTSFGVVGGPAYQWMVEFQEWLVEKGYEVRHQPSTSFQIVAASLAPDGESGQVTICLIDADWIVEPGSAAGTADDIVVNDRLTPRQQLIELRHTEDGWRRWSTLEQRRWTGGTECAD